MIVSADKKSLTRRKPGHCIEPAHTTKTLNVLWLRMSFYYSHSLFYFSLHKHSLVPSILIHGVRYTLII